MTRNVPIQSHIDESLDARVLKHIFLSGLWLKDDIKGKKTVS